MEKSGLKKYKHYIVDKNIWLYIFNKENPRLDSADSLLRCINNTVNLTFIYVFSCIREASKNGDIEERINTFNPNAKRAIKTITRIYNGLDISFELMNYVLTDVQFDLSLGDASCLKQYIPGVSNSFMPFDYSPLILRWMSTSSADYSITVDDLIKLFQKLIFSLGFLSSAHLIEEESDVYFDLQVFDPQEGLMEKKIYTDFKIHILDCGRGLYQYFFLERIEIKDHACLLHYSSPDYSDKYLMVYHDNYFTDKQDNSDNRVYFFHDPENLDNLCSYITGAESDGFSNKSTSYEDGIHNIYTVNYKYLKNLSLAIADELGASDNSIYREQFLRKYLVNPTEDVDLDSIIIMKLIEHLPTTVLYDLLFINGQSFHSIIRNLYRRFNGRVSFKYVDFTKQPVDFSELDRHLVRDLHSRHRLVRQGELAELQAEYIISMILSGSQSEHQYAVPITEAISRLQDQKQLSEAQNALARILMRTCMFYRGVLAYGKIKMEYDAKHYSRMPSEQETAETQMKLHQCFLNAAENVYREEFRQSLTNDDSSSKLANAIKRFLALLELTNNNENERFLKCVLGRAEIADNNQLGLSESLLKMDDVKQIKQIIAYLEFLNTGSFENNEGRGDFNSSIYPVTGKYRSNLESDDQCRVACFSVRIDVDASGEYDFIKNINILSEFSYQINEYYYCLPNINRSNSDWWIDPIIVKASDFDSIID